MAHMTNITIHLRSKLNTEKRHQKREHRLIISQYWRGRSPPLNPSTSPLTVTQLSKPIVAENNGHLGLNQINLGETTSWLSSMLSLQLAQLFCSTKYAGSKKPPLMGPSYPQLLESILQSHLIHEVTQIRIDNSESFGIIFELIYDMII